MSPASIPLVALHSCGMWHNIYTDSVGGRIVDSQSIRESLDYATELHLLHLTIWCNKRTRTYLSKKLDCVNHVNHVWLGSGTVSGDDFIMTDASPRTQRMVSLQRSFADHQRIGYPRIGSRISGLTCPERIMFTMLFISVDRGRS